MNTKKTTAEIITRLRESGDEEAAERLEALHHGYKDWKRKYKQADVRRFKDYIACMLKLEDADSEYDQLANGLRRLMVQATSYQEQRIKNS